jgi:hypothetical protein
MMLQICSGCPVKTIQALMCCRLQLLVGSTYATGASVLLAALADQTSLPLAGRISTQNQAGEICCLSLKN